MTKPDLWDHLESTYGRMGLDLMDFDGKISSLADFDGSISIVPSIFLTKVRPMDVGSISRHVDSDFRRHVGRILHPGAINNDDWDWTINCRGSMQFQLIIQDIGIWFIWLISDHWLVIV